MRETVQRALNITSVLQSTLSTKSKITDPVTDIFESVNDRRKKEEERLMAINTTYSQDFLIQSNWRGRFRRPNFPCQSLPPHDLPKKKEHNVGVCFITSFHLYKNIYISIKSNRRFWAVNHHRSFSQSEHQKYFMQKVWRKAAVFFSQANTQVGFWKLWVRAQCRTVY